VKATPWSAPALLLLLAFASVTVVSPIEAQESWRTVSLSRQLTRDDSMSVTVRYGAGHLRLRGASGTSLYSMQVRYDEAGFAPVAEYTAGHLKLGVETVGRRSIVGQGRSGGGDMDLALAEGVPMHLDLDLGAVRADLDVGGLSLRRLQLRTGASETRLDVSAPNPVRMQSARFEVGAADFTALRLGNLDAADVTVSAGVGKVRLEFGGEWRRDTAVTVEMGLGSLELVVPEELGVRLNRETFLTSWDPEGMVKRGNSYYSTNWDTADRRVTVNVKAAFGSIKVLQLR